jgi:hypothetical protein
MLKVSQHVEVSRSIQLDRVTKRRKGDTKEGGGNEAGNREAHTQNRADLATQASWICEGVFVVKLTRNMWPGCSLEGSLRAVASRHSMR